MGDARLCALGDEVEDCGARRLGAGAGRGGDSNKGKQLLGDGQTLAEGCVDEVEEVVFCAAC